MNNKLNLASKPFTNRSLSWAIVAVLLLVSFVAFVYIVRATGQLRSQAAVIQNDVRKLRQDEEALRTDVGKVETSLSAEQIQTLKAAHALVDRKLFSWSRLFIDLESALPGNVRVTRITVRDVAANASQTVAELDLVVVSKSPETITNMIAEMDRAGVFQAELRAQNLQKGRGETGTEYELLVMYRPRAGAPIAETQPSRLASAAERPSPRALKKEPAVSEEVEK